jgi:phosphatidate phosphatase APP1
MSFFSKDPLQIIAFQSYGTADHLYLRGRAIEDENIDLEGKGFFKLIANNWKRFETDEIRNTEITIKLGDSRVFETKTDAKGYFKISEEIANLQELTNSEGWLQYEISYKNAVQGREIQQENRFLGEMLISSTSALYGVISDIDDTILHTGVASTLKWRVLTNTFFKRVEKRSPLEGAAAFYHKLHKGTTGNDANPIFYVSHSPWNLYCYLDYFLTKNNFPKGPILLRNLPNPFKKKGIEEKPQKQKEIIDLLKMYPDLPFILIGDSGEHDAGIYIEIAEAFPNRIKAIYLRSVKHEKKMRRIKGLFENYKTTPTLLVETSAAAEEHAKENGFIA